jgi:hypothetical protein
MLEQRTFANWRQGSWQRGGIGSFRVAHRPPQARQEQFAVFGVPQVARNRYHDGGGCPEPLNDLSGIVKPTHLGEAGGENAIRLREA